uniref:Uncharacterized protein n=1 Tax=Knipowitschia caucasica TaxID=637954 RepID=A0AAV2K7I0_KNICA
MYGRRGFTVADPESFGVSIAEHWAIASANPRFIPPHRTPPSVRIIHSGHACNVDEERHTERVYTIREGETLELTCLVTGHPRPQTYSTDCLLSRHSITDRAAFLLQGDQ